MGIKEDITKIYVGYYDRAPDPAGLNYWIGRANAGMTLSEIAQSFSVQAESTAKYPYLANPNVASAESFIISVYNNLFNRAPDDAGKAYWLEQLATGKPVGQMIIDIMSGAKDDANGQDKTILDNKVAVGIDWATKTAELANLDYENNAAAKASAEGVLDGVTETAASVTEAKIETDTFVSNPESNPGSTVTLTTAVENKIGTSANDVFNGTDKTLSLDVIDGGAGMDTLNYADSTGGQNLNGLGLSMSNVETVNVRSVGAANADTSGFSGVTKLNATQGTSATLQGSATTDVTAANISGDVAISGGKSATVSASTGNVTINGVGDVTVSHATDDKDITIGAATAVTGNVTITDTKVGSGTIAVDGGKDVTINATGSEGGGDKITVGAGAAAADLPSGAVVINSAHTSAGAVGVTAEALNAIEVTGGSTVTITQSADMSKAAADTTADTLTQGAVTVEAGDATTAVTVTQAASQAAVNAVTAVAGATETASVKFAAINAGETLIAGGLTFTAAKNLTAAEAAQAFAGLINGTLPAAGDSQGVAASSLGVFTGTFTGWTSGAASGDTVVFTSTTANSNVANLTFAGTGAAPTVTTTAGSAATAAVEGKLGVVTGEVTIDDNATASITDITLDGYGAASLGSTTALSKLVNLSLANSGGAAAGATNAAVTADVGTVSTLNLALNNVQGAVSIDDGAATVKTLNVTTSGKDSSFALTAAAVETLAVSGDKAVSFTSDLDALKTVTVSGSAGLSLTAAASNTITSINTSATTGTVTSTIEGGDATYTGGAGKDNVTLAADTAVTKVIDLGAGDDMLTFGAAIASATTAINGGAGTDKLSMTVANAAALDGAAQTVYTGFEQLVLNDVYGDDDNTLDTETIDLANLGMTNHVTTSGTLADTTTAANSDVLVLDKLANGGTVVLTANGLVTVNVADAATGTADVLNVELSSTGNLAAGTLTAANVETVNITTVDTEAAPQTKNVDSLTLNAAAAKTVNVSGSADLTLTLTGSTAVTAINASGSTGGVTVTSQNTSAATTITGGSGNDVLTAATGTTADVLIGGAGDDTLTANAGLSTMTGGTGNDLFVVNTASQNVNSYSTITDFAAGDLLEIAGASSFNAAKIVLADTAVFQDYANAAVNVNDADDAVTWFQFGGNTFVVKDAANATADFQNGTDFIVKLTGLIDLSAASFNDTHDTIGF